MALQARSSATSMFAKVRESKLSAIIPVLRMAKNTPQITPVRSRFNRYRHRPVCPIPDINLQESKHFWALEPAPTI
jgi:hypothetical protein